MIRINGNTEMKTSFQMSPKSREVFDQKSFGHYLSVSAVSKSYDKSSLILQDINLNVKRGELVALLGPSGCGKTTLLNLLGGFLTANSGEIILDGKNITDLPPHKRDMPIVFQDYALFPQMTVRKNVEFGLKQRNIPKLTIADRCLEALQMVKMQDYVDRYPSELSGGQQQRVALARGLAVRPKVLLLDEPLSNLDAQLRVEMRDEIRLLLTEQDITGIMVTHDQEEALSFADRVVLLNMGIIEQNGTPSEIYKNPDTEFVATFMGFENLLEIDSVSVVDETWRCKTAFGEFVFKGASIPKTASSRFKVAVRPSNIHVHDTAERIDEEQGADFGNNTFFGTVRGVSFLGSRYRLRIQAKDVLVVADTSSRNSTELAPGSEVAVSISNDSATLVEA
jgi:putative spermidine/putrescine transport system ATP-binding protein